MRPSGLRIPAGAFMRIIKVMRRDYEWRKAMRKLRETTIHTLIKTFILLVLMVPMELYASSMGDYCVMPPYVKTNVKPNIMIIMDNAVDMGEPAYCTKDANFSTNHLCTDNYNPATTYSGYYKPGLKYAYGSNKWLPDANGAYSGNLLNWATTSKYDLLQSILVGGISTSRQSNVNTLVSKSNTWIKTLTYSIGAQSYTCIFNVNNANVEITEPTPNACGYLDTPTAHPVSGDPIVSAIEPNARFAADQQNQIADPVSKPGSPGVWTSIVSAIVDFLVPSAEAAPQLRISGGPGTLTDGTECTAGYYVALSASGGTELNYTWSISSGSLPPGLSLGASGTPSTSITGTPTASGVYTFTVRVADSGGNSDTKSYTITILNATVTISSTSPLQEGYVNSFYELYQQTAATSACNSYTWSVTGGSLPPGIYLNTTSNISFLELYGTPTTAGTYAFTLQVTDSGNNTASKSFTLVVNPATVGLTITTSSPLNNGIVGQYFFARIFTPSDADRKSTRLNSSHQLISYAVFC